MSKKINEKLLNEDGSLAAETLHPNSGSAGKAELMQSLVNTMAGMSVQDLSDLFNRVQDSIGHEADEVDPSFAEKNKNSIEAKPSYATEEFNSIFEGQDLSEEFKLKATTLFEAAVSVKVDLVKATLEEEYENQMQEEVSELVENLDSYLNYAVEEWMKENKLEATNILKQDVHEEFIEGLKELFKEHYIEIPEDKVNVVEELVSKVNSLEDKLNETTEENIQLKGIISEAEKLSAFEQVTEGLTQIQTEKVQKLTESVSYTNIDEYIEKIKVLKESVVPNAKKNTTGLINEEFIIEEDTEETITSNDPTINRYVNAITRTSKK